MASERVKPVKPAQPGPASPTSGSLSAATTNTNISQPGPATTTGNKPGNQPAPARPGRRPGWLRVDKRLLRAFGAGALAAILVFSILLTALNPGWLAGTFTRQIGSRTLAQEVNLQPVTAAPATLKAAAEIEQTFNLALSQAEIKSTKTDYYQLGGFFRDLKISAIKPAGDQLAITIKGKIADPHAYGPDVGNPDGEIYVMPEALQDSTAAFAARITIEYPQLNPQTTVLEEKPAYSDQLVFTLQGDTFRQVPTAADITLGGGFTGMTVAAVRQQEQELALTITGGLDPNGGNGIVTLAGTALGSAFSVDQVIRIAGTACLFSFTPLTVEEPLQETLLVGIDHDSFATDLTADMFTLGGGLADARITEVRPTDQPNAVWLTIQGAALRQPGSASLRAEARAVTSGRAVTGTIDIRNPDIYAFHVMDSQANQATDNQVYDLYTLGNDFLPYLQAGDFVLKDALSFCKITAVKWLNGYHVLLTVRGLPGNGEGRIAVRSAALGGVTGADAVVQKIRQADLLIAGTSDAALLQAPQPADQASSPALLQTSLPSGLAGLDMVRWQQILSPGGLAGGNWGNQMPVSGIRTLTAPSAGLRAAASPLRLNTTPASEAQLMWGLDQLIDWGIDKVKGLVIEGIKSGLKAGATKGLMYGLRETGLQGPAVEDLLKEIQTSLDQIQKQLGTMQNVLSEAISDTELNGQLASLLEAQTKIKRAYEMYVFLQSQIKDYEAANPGKKALDDPDIRHANELFMNEIATKDIETATLQIAQAMAGNSQATSLITIYYNNRKHKLPFEHNAAENLRQFYQEMLMLQTQGLLLYAEYCNYNMASSQLFYNNKLETMTNTISESLDAQKKFLPPDSVFKVKNNPLSGDIRVKSNYSGKSYILVKGASTMAQLTSDKQAKSGFVITYYIPVNQNKDGTNSDKALVKILRDRGNTAVNTASTESGDAPTTGPYRELAKSDIADLLYYHKEKKLETNTINFFAKYTGADGLVDYLYLKREGSSIFALLGPLDYNYDIYDMRTDSYRTFKASDLFSKYKDYYEKIILAVR